jgi:hypothetical protein
MTLDEAVAMARRIQRDLDAGRLTVPYPAEVRAQLEECHQLLNEADDATAAELVRRLQAPEPAKTMALPW